LVAARNRAALLEWAATLDPDERALLLEVLTGEDAPPLLSGLSDADLDRMILGGLSDETLWKLLSIAARYALPGHAGRELGSRPGDGYQFEVGGGLVRLSPEYKALVDLKIYLGNHGLNEPPYQGGKNGGTGE
jgi:hypothetical protein